MKQRWGSYGKVVDPMRDTPGSLLAATLLFAYLITWSLAMAAFIAAYAFTVLAAALMVLISLPCFLWSKVSPKDWSHRPGRGPRARLTHKD